MRHPGGGRRSEDDPYRRAWTRPPKPTSGGRYVTPDWLKRKPAQPDTTTPPEPQTDDGRWYRQYRELAEEDDRMGRLAREMEEAAYQRYLADQERASAEQEAQRRVDDVRREMAWRQLNETLAAQGIDLAFKRRGA